ncbi:hypothetical protein NEMBOFW57_004173 [Staphylotrichum longicolle]|uniref:NodB homology domain-containing protein n=1 Tax=Staphylotrichum longicolle TaxID=669026 RepID=A0AAD4I072_9PEZI|nr:hypothetical protein NEMBOFW57_004173 [Staphylotrichum longicolle]
MPSQQPPTSSPWPAPYKAAISFTMDNLGEAQDVLKNAWPHPIGTHPAVTTQLPRMLTLLAKYGVRATYFAEAWSLGVYPSAVKALTEAGHEVAWHGYQHEVWSGLDEEQERESFRKSWEAARREGVEYVGFRPPGGGVNERTWGLLKEYGVGYVSPLGEFGVGEEGVVVLPFEWRAVDAFWYMEKFAGIRKGHGERDEVLSPGEFKTWLMGKIEEVTSEEKFGVMEDVLKRISEDGEIWVAPCQEVAAWVRNHPERFGRDQRSPDA